MSARGGDVQSAFLFPGAAVKMCGRERDFFQRHESVMRPFLEEGSASAVTDLIAAISDETHPSLTELQSQALTYSYGCGVAAVFVSSKGWPHFMAGYSLGIYSAFAAADAVSFHDGLAIIREAYTLAEAACANKACGMAVIIGFGAEQIDDMLRHGDYASVCLVNSNNATAHVLSGKTSELQALVDDADARGAFKAAVLDVTVPYHHPVFLQEVRAPFEDTLRQFAWRAARCPIISSIDQRPLREPEELIAFTARNIVTPVNWQRVMETLMAQDVVSAYECGIGISLTQNGRMLPDAPRFINIKNAHQRAAV